MAQEISFAITAALGAFVRSPTTENREQLLAAADEYRELWIKAQAGKKSTIQRSNTPTSYERAQEVVEVVDGIPVKLALQERTSAAWDDPWWVLSWRTKYSADGSNRRFYMTKAGCWTIPAETALGMMEDMKASGGMADEYLDWRGTNTCEALVSTELLPAERAREFAAVTSSDEDWGDDPFFVIASDPHRNWKKVMIVNRANDLATFRSITEDRDYMPKKVLRSGASWWLDNSMMDANVQQMRCFIEYLRRHVSARLKG